MYGINAGGWLAVHHAEHRELIERAARAARRRPRERRQTAPVSASVLVAPAPVCC